MVGHPSPHPPQLFFEDVEVGDVMPAREFGPHTLVSAVFWAGIQENPAPLHFDRDYVQSTLGVKSIVASGALRQSLLIRAIMEWAGPRAFLRSMSLRHTGSTYEGDMQVYSASIAGKAMDDEAPVVALDLDGRNQVGEQIIKGRCDLLLPRRDWPPTRAVWENFSQ